MVAGFAAITNNKDDRTGSESDVGYRPQITDPRLSRGLP